MLTQQVIESSVAQPTRDTHATWLIRISMSLGAVGFLATLAGVVAVQVFVLAAMMLAAGGVARLAAISAGDRRERAGWNWFALCFFFLALYSFVCLPDGE